ncbi:MAG: thiolase family protein [Methanobacteriota archaeon]
MEEVAIASAVRTPIGKFNGSLRDRTAVDLGSAVVRESLSRALVRPDEVDEVILGTVLAAGLGQNPARQAALGAGIPYTVAAMTVNKVCGSSLKAVTLGVQAIRCGDAKVVVAGGMESMTNAPYLLPKARNGLRLGNAELVDSMIHDGLLDAYEEVHMGITGEVVAEEFGVSREESDRFAFESHQKAWKATENGLFKSELLPMDTEPEKGKRLVVDRDDGIRPDTTVERLGKLRPAFKEGGIVTAGSASQISDGAAAVVLMPRAEAERRGLEVLGLVTGYTVCGVQPVRVMAAPIPGVQALLKKTGHSIDEVDLFEHNEAFATASCAVRKALSVPADRFNVNGGAVALGHPLGASGARVLTTLLYAMKARGGHRGVATLCLGGGNAVSMMVERP